MSTLRPCPTALWARRIDRRIDRRLMWLLCLALLVPLTQAWSSWHAFSHISPTPSSEHESNTLHLAQCELCLAAAAIDAIAPPTTAPRFASLSVAETQPPPALSLGPSGREHRAYQSRAPPRFV